MTNISIPQASFDANKQALKQFYKSQNAFIDIDFDGSYISALVDGLAYNTTIQEYYYNMAVNETRRSTARQRHNVIARAQEKRYVPKSFASATAIVNFDIVSSNIARPNVTIPAGTVITGSVDNRMFTFSTTQPVVTTVTNIQPNSIQFTATNVEVVEGITTSDSYILTENSDLFEITNVQVDTSSIKVSVIEDQQAPVEFTNVQSVVGTGNLDKVFFIRVQPNGNYAIYFGDGISGYRPKNNSIIVIDYRISNGQLPNGITKFIPGQPIDNEVNITITTISGSQGGDVYEDIESIRFNGDQANNTQNRSIYQSDFENDLKKNFSIISDVSVVGGEDVFPPQYGKILITAVDKNLNNLSSITINQITKFLANRTPVTTSFIFNKANIIRIGVTSKVTTSTPIFDLRSATRTAIIAEIERFAQDNIGKFGKSLYRSRIETAINNSSPNVISNSTDLTMIQQVTTGNSHTIEFGNPIRQITSSKFTFNSVDGKLRDLNGTLVVINNDNQIISSQPVGTINYQTGSVTITSFNSQFNQPFDLIAVSENDDITASGNVVLKINLSDITII